MNFPVVNCCPSRFVGALFRSAEAAARPQVVCSEGCKASDKLPAEELRMLTLLEDVISHQGCSPDCS